MRKLFLFLLILVVLQKPATAQVPVTDTLAYLQTIVANKSFFIGKPFSVLRDSLKIQIKFFSPFASIPHEKNKETSTQFSFYFPPTLEELWLTYPSLRISWYPYLDANQSSVLYTQYRSVGWAPAVSTFYGSGVVADISIRE